MKDPKRIDKALEILGHYWKKYPDLRLGQLLCNVTEDGLDGNPNLYYVEDEYLMVAIMMRYGTIEDKEGFKESMRKVLSMFGDAAEDKKGSIKEDKKEDRIPGETRETRETREYNSKDKDQKDKKDIKDKKDKDCVECIFHAEDIPSYYTYSKKMGSWK